MLAVLLLAAPLCGLVITPRGWCPTPARRSVAPPRCSQGGLDAELSAKEQRVRQLREELAKLQREEAELEEWDDAGDELDMNDVFDDLDESDLAELGLKPSGAPATEPSQTSPPLAAVAASPSQSRQCELPPGSIVCVAGCQTPVGRALLQSLAACVPDRGWTLRALVGASERPPDLAGVEPMPASPAELGEALEGASALVILSEGAVGKGGVCTAEVGQLLAALPPAGLQRLVYVSVHGAERTSQLPYSLQNAFGGKLDRAREAEGEVRLRAVGRIPAVSVVRLGGVKETGGAEVCELAPGDALQGEVSASAVAGLLVQTLTRQETVNATFSAGPTLAGAGGWDDELIKLVGPEIYRRRLGPDLTSGEPLVNWVRTWARERGAIGLTSKVQVQDVPGGAMLRFVKGAAAFDTDFDRVESKDQKWAAASVVDGGRVQTDGAIKIVAETTPYGRVRVVRSEMEDGAQPKEMSEAALLQKLQRDLDKLETERTGKGM